MIRSLIPIAMLILTSHSAPAADYLKDGPFAGVDLSKLSQKHAKTIRAASEDFLLILKGKKPKHAVVDKEAPLPADGGTTFYKGDGYELVIVQSLSSFSKLHGYVYGPVLTFDSAFASGNQNTVQSTRFYTSQQLRQLKEKAKNRLEASGVPPAPQP